MLTEEAVAVNSVGSSNYLIGQIFLIGYRIA
jgi:hypothetical protein